MKLEVLHVLDCPNLTSMLKGLGEVTELPITTRLITTEAEAAEFGMAGSPTLLIDGIDPFAATGGCDSGVSCRLYRDSTGRIIAAPPIEQLRAAIVAAQRPAAPGEVLSAWRTRALPLDPVESAVQRAVLRAFAATGQPPTRGDFAVVTMGSGRSSAEVLTALHEVDAIRLAPGAQITVAYPFSATPSRHRVRIGAHGKDGVDVFAMCAIDALGVSAMTGQDTLIESVDVTTGQPVTVTMSSGGDSSWAPVGAVVFIGADAGGGPSADCCCDYLNFFSSWDAAHAWASAHPHVPGQILDQAEAEELGVRLFGHLLTSN
jgi:hypothetical protein